MPANDNMGLFGAIHQVRDVQLVNWSLFRGYHHFSLSVDFDEPAPTVLTGDSGIGKSAIIDAIFEVLAKNPKYNPASNKGTRGSSTSKDSRTLVSYIRGKTSNEQSEEGMETQLMHSPVDQPVWSAIVITAVNDMGGLSVVGKAYWADAGCDNNSGVACVMFTAKEEFDPRCLEPISSARFTARALENLGFETLETYSSLTSFTAAVYSMLGISNNADPDKVIELLTAARAGSQFPSVGELFKDMVLTTPSALAAAEEAVEGFDVVSGSWQRIQTIEKKRRCLQGLPEHVSAWRNSQELLRGLSEVDEGAAAAAIAEVQREYAAKIDETEARDHILEKRERSAEILQEEYERVKGCYDAAAAALREGGEAEVERLRQLSADAVKKLKDVREQRDSLRKNTAELFGDIPLTREDYAEWRQSALDRLESQDDDMSKAHERRAELAIERAKVAEERDALIEQRRYMEENRGKVPLGLRRARTGLAEALGVDPSELPFAAELMEIVDEEHTGVVEGALYDLARTILVDSRLARDFGPLVEGLGLGARTRVEFADAGMEAAPLDKRGYASSLVSLDVESPFCGWLSNRIAREDTDALVTDAASLADAEGVAVTARGQVRDGSRGALGSDGFEGTTISCADYYLEIQADLARESVENLSEKWIEDMYQYVNQQICALDTALDRDKREIAAKVAELNDVMAPLPFGLEHGTLELVLEWSEPACFTEWRREVANLRKQAGSSSSDAGIDAASLMRRTAKAVEVIRERPSNLKASPSEVAAHTMERAKVLDRRTHLNLFARDTYRDADGLKHMKVIRSLNTSSGGECQEASAFIQAIALLCALRCDTVSGKPHPSFGLVILDEAFVKSSPAFAKRGIAAWCACGFQVLMAVPSNNAQCVFEKAKVAYSIIRDGRNRSAIAPQILVEKGDGAESSKEAGR